MTTPTPKPQLPKKASAEIANTIGCVFMLGMILAAAVLVVWICAGANPR